MRKQNKENYRTERKGFNILLDRLPDFYVPTNEEKKYILDLLGIVHRYTRTFDGIIMKVDNVYDIKNFKDFTMVEVKTTKKVLKDFPSKFFFGMTLNEESFMKIFRKNYLLCLVEIPQEKFELFDYDKLMEMVHNNRTQLNINLK